MKHNAKRSGSVLVLAVVLMIVFVSLAALAVDFARVQVAKTELRRATDAAALYAVSGLADGSAKAKAMSQAMSNGVDGVGLSLDAGDIVLGTWDDDEMTFTPATFYTDDVNAVRVVGHRTAERGSSVPTPFASILGFKGSNLTAATTATLEVPTYGWSVVGLKKMDIGDDVLIDSYDGSKGPYSSGKSQDHAKVGSNGNIKVHKNAVIRGDVNAGKKGSLHKLEHAQITGSVSLLTQKLIFPLPPSGSYLNNNNDAAVPTDYLEGKNDFHLRGNQTYNMPGGVYYFHDFKMTENAQLNITDPVTIYVDHHMELLDSINTSENSPANLKIIVLKKDDDLRISHDGKFYGQIYAPKSKAKIDKSGQLFGSIIVNELKIEKNAQIHVDQSLKDVGGPAKVTSIVQN